MDISNVGLIIWGCKGGYRVFCSNNVVDYQTPVIRDTIKDIRSFIRFNQSRINVYALEFTDEYKIYTLYRSCNDSGTGGYVAFIIYVPHSLLIKGIRTLLDQMMDKYFDEYVHPLTGTYYAGKYDNIEPYNVLLREWGCVEDSRRQRVHRSVQNDIPKIFIYHEPNEVDTFYESPYRKEFYDCQEVMFIADELYQQRSKAFDFVGIPDIIGHVSSPETLPWLNLKEYSNYIQSLKINGVRRDCATSYQVNDSDCISLILKKQYYKAYSLEGAIEYLLSQKYLTLANENITLNLQKIQFEEECLNLSVYVNDHLLTDKDAQIYLVFSKDNIQPVTPKSIFASRLVGQAINWGIMNGGKIILSQNQLKIDQSSNKIDFYTSTFQYHVRVDNICIRQLTIGIGHNTSFSLPINEEIQFTLPRDYDKANFKFTVDSKDEEVSVLNDVITIAPPIINQPKNQEYSLLLPNLIQQDEDWDFQIQGISKRVNNIVRLRSGEDIIQGQLIYKNLTFNCTLSGNNTIIPQCVLLIPKDCSISISYNDVEYRIDTPMMFPEKPIIMDYENYVIREINSGVYEVRNNVESQIHDDKNIKLRIKLDSSVEKFCRALCIGKSVETTTWAWLHQDIIEIGKSQYIDVYFFKLFKVTSVRIYADRQQYEENLECDDKNKKHGFLVSYDDDKHASVKYEEPSPRNRFIIPSLMAVMLCLLIGVGVYFFRSQGPNVLATVAFHINGTDRLALASSKWHIACEDSSLIVPLANDSLGRPQINILINDSDLVATNREAYLKKIRTKTKTLTLYYDTIRIELSASYGMDIESLLDQYSSNKQKKDTTFQITPQFTGRLKKLKETKPDSLYEKANLLAREYPFLSDSLRSLCSQNVDTSDIQSLSIYMRKLDKSLCDSLVVSRYNKMESQLAAIDTQISSWIEEFHNDACSYSTIKAASIWLNKVAPDNKDYATNKIGCYITAYTIFFTTHQKEQMDNLLSDKENMELFTTKQLNTIKIYCQNSSTFSTLIKNNKIQNRFLRPDSLEIQLKSK